MKPRISLLMLPGMDGTGDLFKPLLESCPEEFEPIVVRYPRDRHADSEELVDLIRQQLPEDRAVLVAESFSGNLAIRVAASSPLRIKALILCNAFLRSPAPSLTRFLPWSFLMRRKPPEWAVRRFLVGSGAPIQLVSGVRSAIASVSPSVLTSRLRSILVEDGRAVAEKLTVPVLYLRAQEDVLIGRRSVEEIRSAIATVEVRQVPGPHLLLQTAPQSCWSEIRRFVLAV